MPVDGTYPTGTTQWEKRNIALEVPVWDPNICIQCGKCVMVCPHAVIRAKVYEPGELADAPETFKSAEARWKELARPEVHPASRRGRLHRLRAVRGSLSRPRTRPRWAARPSTWSEQLPLREQEIANWDFFPKLPEYPSAITLSFNNVKNVQLLRAALRVLRRLRRLRRDALPQADQPAVRRPRGHRQCHRLLEHLRRQPADHAVVAQPAKAAARPGPTRCSKTTPNLVWACA